MRTVWMITISLGLAVPAAVQAADRLYVMDCGHNSAKDQSRWSPGVNVGTPIELSDMCVLIKHGEQWLLWDTGYPDASPIGGSTHPSAMQHAQRSSSRPPMVQLVAEGLFWAANTVCGKLLLAAPGHKIQVKGVAVSRPGPARPRQLQGELPRVGRKCER